MKERFTLLCILLILSPALYAAVRTTTQSGNWDAACPGAQCVWNDGLPFSTGDSAAIQNGHLITIPVGSTAIPGESPADNTGTSAIACASGTGNGRLTIQGTLIFRGPVSQCASVWTIEPGAIVTHDSSQCVANGCASAAATNYKWRFTGAAAQTTAFLYAVGTAGSRITFNVAVGSGNSGGFTSYNDAGNDGNVFVEYADIDKWGTSTLPLYRGYPATCSTSIVRGVTFKYSKITNSGEIRVGPSFGSCTVDLYNLAISSPAGGAGWSIGAGNPLNTDIATNGFRRVENVMVDGARSEIQAHATNDHDFGLRFRNNYFRSATSASNPYGSAGRIKAGSGYFDLNWFETRDPVAGGGAVIPVGLTTRTMLAINDADNAHFSTTIGGSAVLDGGFAYNFLAGNKGDDVFQLYQLVSTGETSPVFEIKNWLTIPSPAGDLDIAVFNVNPGTQCTGTNCVQFNVHNNTYFTGAGAGMGADAAGLTFETRNGYLGQVDALINNIIWRQTSGAGYITNWAYGSQAIATGTFEQADYNVTYNLTNSPKYASELGAFAEYATTPGANDQSLDPMFVDSTRNPITYGQRWDPTITTSDQLAAKFLACYQRMADGTTSCDPRFNLEDMYNWIRAGFRPRNPAVWTASATGSHVGAVAPTKTFGVLAQ